MRLLLYCSETTWQFLLSTALSLKLDCGIYDMILRLWRLSGRQVKTYRTGSRPPPYRVVTLRIWSVCWKWRVAGLYLQLGVIATALRADLGYEMHPWDKLVDT